MNKPTLVTTRPAAKPIDLSLSQADRLLICSTARQLVTTSTPSTSLNHYLGVASERGLHHLAARVCQQIEAINSQRFDPTDVVAVLLKSRQ